MKRSKTITVNIEPQVFKLMVEKLGPRRVGSYAYGAVLAALVKDEYITAEWLISNMTPPPLPEGDGLVVRRTVDA